MDYSTLNIDKLKKRPVYVPTGGNYVSKSQGNGCYLDAPGYPTYFTRCVYNRHGNDPQRGPHMVITFEGVHYVVETAEDWKPGMDWDTHHARIQKRLHGLWVPLPLDHLRSRMWIEACYRHLHHCYIDDSKPERADDHIFIYPVPRYKLELFMDDPRFPSKEEVDRKNAEIVGYWENLATPDNHAAVRGIRKFYPDYQPEQDLIEGKFKLPRADWWECDADQPTPENCPGKYGHKHPMSKNWCQFCGWQQITEEK